MDYAWWHCEEDQELKVTLSYTVVLGWSVILEISLLLLLLFLVFF